MIDIWRRPGSERARPREVPPAELEARREGERGFAAMVKQLREDVGYSIVQFAAPLRRAGIGPSDVSAIEAGKVRASAEWVRYYADSLRVPFTKLFDVWDREALGTEHRMTVAEARAAVQRLLKVGVECPCCGRIAKERRQSLTPNMCRFVRWLVQNYRGEPLEIRGWQREHAEYGGDYAKTEHWGLTKREHGRDPLWSPTLKGTKFARGQVKVHKVAILWRNEVLRWEGDLLDVQQLLREDPEHDNRGGEPPPTLPGIDRT